MNDVVVSVNVILCRLDYANDSLVATNPSDSTTKMIMRGDGS